MMLEGSNQSTAISWIREDLDKCLEQVRDNLEEFSEEPDERRLIQFVQDKLEQLNLTFVTMQQDGATMLTDEMIAVGGNILHNKDANLEESLSALSDAIVVLPSYLDRLQAGHDDLPILLLPTLNELRASYDESMLSEGTLFAPDLDVRIGDIQSHPDEPVSAADFDQFAQKIRAQYQTALLNWLKEQQKIELLEPLLKVSRTLFLRLQRNSLRRLWWIAEHIIEGLQAGVVDNDLPLRRMFARLDLNLKSMVEGGEDGPSEDAITALSRALLFHVAAARSGCRPVDELRDHFRLEEIIPDRHALLRARGAVTGRDARLFASIGQAIREEMVSIKDSLDMELRTGRIDSEARSAIVSSLIQLSDTLELLDLPVPAAALQGLLPSLELTREVENFELDSPLLSLAQQLLEVESVLDKHIQLLGEPLEEADGESDIMLPNFEQRQIVSRMLDEAVTSLHEAQEAIRERLENGGEADFTSPLQHISGAMFVAGQMEVAKLTDKLEGAFNACLMGLGPNEEEPGMALIMLTDAVAALELYLTGCRDEQANSLKFLDIMQDRLEGLPEASASGQVVKRTVVKLPQRHGPRIEQPAAETKSADTGTPPAQHAEARAETGSEAVDQLPSAIDSSMQDVFLEEFGEVRRELEESISTWLTDTSRRKPLEEIRRGFHTLKGSGRMVGAKELGDFSWRIESMLNRILEKKVETTESIADFLRVSVDALPSLKQRMLQEPTELTVAGVRRLSEAAKQISGGDKFEISDLEEAIPAAILYPDQASEQTDQGTHDSTLIQLMVGEIRQYLDALEPYVSAAESGSPVKASIDQVRAVHSLAGSLALAPAGDEAKLARVLEGYLQAQSWADKLPNSKAGETLRACLQRFEHRLAVLDGRQEAATFAANDEALISAVTALRSELSAADSTEISAATQEPVEAAAEETSAEIEAEAQPQAEEPESESESESEEAREQAAEVAEAKASGHEAAEPEAEEPGQLAGVDNEILGIFLGEATEVLERCDTILNTWRDKLSDEKLVQNLQREIHTFKGGARMAGLSPLGDLSHAMETLLEKIAGGVLPPTVAAVQALEEGCDRLNIWVEKLTSGQLPEDGGALKRFRSKADLLVSGRTIVESEPVPPPAEPAEVSEPDTQVPAEADATSPDPDVEELSEQADQQPAQPEIPDFQQSPALAAASSEIDKLDEIRQDFIEIGDQTTADEEAPQGAQIRVAADLMDSLVNFSGEISIYRARLEEQLGTVRFNLKEVDQTVGRLKEQLRKMETETEAQMLSRYHQTSAKTTSEFDPLELDRFSNIQQLSRALGETVSDLLSLHEMLDDSVREAETLLGSQSRVSNDLQDGLMQTRMTPFGSAAPRMRRVVRAAAAETGKKARLKLMVGGASDRLDRNVLERITAPMEHMLRNAVTHGIESPDQRAKAGKPEEGVISVTVSAEATEFVVRVQDDGAGLNLDAIHKRAIDRGMITKSDKVSPRQMARFVLESGFSTAEKVTGLAGRGVGMDVVNSEIKQIGGSVEIATEKGKGSRFTVRIPFSLAVMQVIGFSVGSKPYHVPLNSVAGVGRMSPADYSKLIKRESPSCEFAGEEYPLMELGPLLGMNPDPLESDNVSLLMVDNGELRAAFRISDLRGHQEVVIKPVGPQISSIPGILGATISGDGRVVIILDMGPLIRNGAGRPITPVEPPVEELDDLRPPLVMVIDDSITMRKVTTRVLESHSLKTLSAKDGVDAIEKLHDCIPDLILLDIEMPRMDGYELAEHVRSDSRLRKVPIIMVTSRSGQKHRKRARKLGANGYLTKPYQEAELIEQVGELLVRNLTRKAD
ncbi:MAG TPA: Hpt domain-containing protein [Xanthomonadales bacterium]|nr:Hpt domain-containing protein [Xanthomonadales bacterium]